MYFKGCDNSNKHESYEDFISYREAHKRTFGYHDDEGRYYRYSEGSYVRDESKDKKMVFDSFLGKYIEDKETSKLYWDDKKGKWVSREQFKMDHPDEYNRILIMTDRPSNVFLSKTEGDWKKGEDVRLTRKQILKKMSI